MQVYKLTNDERLAIEALNESRKDVLLIVCDIPEIGCAVNAPDLANAKFDKYRKLLPVSLDSEKIVEYKPTEDSLSK